MEAEVSLENFMALYSAACH